MNPLKKCQSTFGIILSVLILNINQIIMKVTVGLIVGIAVGVGIGLLIAPEKGSETRKKLADSAGDWMENLKDLFGSGEEKEASHPRSKGHQRTPRTT